MKIVNGSFVMVKKEMMEPISKGDAVKNQSFKNGICKLVVGAISLGIIPVSVSAQVVPKLKTVLVYSGNQWAHESIPDVTKFVKDLGTEKGFKVIEIGAAGFTNANLKDAEVVVLNNTVGFGGTINPSQQDAFKAWYEAGGGIVGFHSSMDHRNNWSWYSDVVGNIFVGHSSIEFAVAYVPPEAKDNPIVKGLGTTLKVDTVNYPMATKQFEEYYNYQTSMEKVAGTTVLLKMVHKSYECGCSMDLNNHQAAWTREYKGGRQFVTTYGGTTKAAGGTIYSGMIKEMYWRGLRWAAKEDLNPVNIGSPKSAHQSTLRMDGGRLVLNAQGLSGFSNPSRIIAHIDLRGRFQVKSLRN